MKPFPTAKLQLRRETLRALTSRQLASARGGAEGDPRPQKKDDPSQTWASGAGGASFQGGGGHVNGFGG